MCHRLPYLRIRRIVASVCLLFFCSAVASEAGRTVRAIFIQPPDKAPEKALLFMEGGSVEIELPSRNLSPEVDLPAGDLSAFVLSEAPPTGGKPPQGAQLVRIPEEWSRCILLFFPVPDNKAFPARVIPLNASTGDFPLGHTLIYNVSPAKVAAKFGDLRVDVKPGGTASLKPPLAKFGDYPVAIDCLFPGDSKPTSICRSQWQHDPEVRQLLFVTPAPGYKVPRVWSILDRPGGKDDR